MPLFSDDAARRISRVVRIVEGMETPVEPLLHSDSPGSQSAFFLSHSSGIAAKSGGVLGSATCDQRKLDTAAGTMGNYQVAGVTQAAKVWNASATAIPGSIEIVAVLVDANWIAREYPYQPLIRFTLAAALTTSEASETGTIVTQYGPGTASPSTGAGAITLHNLLTSTGGVYVFEGASGAAGLARWDSGTNYRIIQLECP